jgi:hypothetical protein
MRDTMPDPLTDIVAAIRQAAETEQGQLRCALACQVARRLGVTLEEVGAAADASGVRISHCQMGLFGYGSKAEGKSKVVRAMEAVPPALAERMRGRADERGGLTCAEVWAIARQSRISRLQAAGAVEGLGLRVSVCQLGCFKSRSRSG